jgi:4-hydroxybenzoate polyprenyltransferase
MGSSADTPRLAPLSVKMIADRAVDSNGRIGYSGWVLAAAKQFFQTIKFEHTVFALPFAYLTLFLVSGGWPKASDFLWVTVAMIAGRTFGMAANRLIDAKIDARNPRTASRAIPAGRLSGAAAMAFMAVALGVFLVSVYNLQPICRKLWPIAIVVMVAYPYAKRFTWMSHLFLGLVYLLIPTGVWLAVAGGLSRAGVALGMGAGLWVAGFDIIYACQDVEVDRGEGLHSIPADIGVGPALWISRLLHAGFVAALAYAGALLGAGVLYYSGLVATLFVLVYEHRLVSPRDLSNVNAAFFTANGAISVVLFVLVALDTVI